jgi:hypothetical protein
MEAYATFERIGGEIMDWMQDAIDQTIAASAPGFDNKAQAVSYYQGKYGQSKTKSGAYPWKQHIRKDILAVREVRPDIDKTEYKRQDKNLAKRFDPQRLNNAEPKNKKEYQDLSLAIGVRKAPKGGYHVHYEGGIQWSECKQVSFDVDITGELADEVAAHPDRVVQIAIMIYMQQTEEEDEDSIPGPCGEDGDPVVTVYANPDNYKTPTRKFHKSSARRFFK